MTNSRDTQELLPEAGQEMLRIFHTHPARTSLLQDFAFYEVSAHFFPASINLIEKNVSSAASDAEGSNTATIRDLFP